ncbi:hypothetical protein MCOR32_010878 [Pyricularia oryzae]|nr:hypothetical protein MCOR32_010878 [Pyricularia oryzae]
MGEGKSSVIVPLVVFLLADGTQLVRVIVAKPQSKQMLQMLLAKLGGLLDVHVFQLPFSRALRLDPAKVNDIAADLNRCMRKDGILLEVPASLEIHNQFGMGSFPRLRILKANGKQALVQEIASRICATGLSGLPIARQNEKSRAALLTYLTKVKLTPAEINAVECAQQGGFWSDATKAPFFLFRGIFAGGVLAFILARKRWKVNYGLDPMRQPPTRLAVPYRAKDSPSPRSEFSHPKVVLFLTNLSYYYGGLNNEDLFVTFGQLLKSDQPDQEYNAWIADAPNLDSSFHHLEGVNIKDKPQCVQLLSPKLRYAKAVVDYFLGHVVFPKYIKEFPSKLSGSGWDIGQVKTRPISGFSGINDARKLLPLSVTHLDLPSQKHINALVLDYFLKDDNHVSLIPHRTTTGSDADQLLTMVIKMQ